jgi:hypothetical protein
MIRQCAWCLRLIDSGGERVSQLPLPKLYEASHGICDICGTLWMEQVVRPSEVQSISLKRQCAARKGTRPLLKQRWQTTSSTVTQLVLELQRHEREDRLTTPPKLSGSLHVL